MYSVAEVFCKKRIDAQDRILLSLSLQHISHHKGSHVAAVLEVAWVDGLLTHLVENFSPLIPRWKDTRGAGRFRATDELVSVVLSRSSDHAILRHVGHYLLNFALRQGDANDQAFAVGQFIFSGNGEGKSCRQKQ